jgi:hypothetical protein
MLPELDIILSEFNCVSTAFQDNVDVCGSHGIAHQLLPVNARVETLSGAIAVGSVYMISSACVHPINFVVAVLL